jgi:carbamate kinase
MRLVIALGGNALLQRGERPDAAVQIKHVAGAARALAEVSASNEVVVVHGNGPQVGMLALESDADASLSRPYPLSDLVAETQGMIGYWLQQAMANAGLSTPVVALVTQTVVDAADPAFQAPTKFVGAVYSADRAHELAVANGWTVGQDGGDWRRVVASPLPVRIIELDSALVLLRSGSVVILAGGGGVPVTDVAGRLCGVDAVVDKDYTAALVAQELNADALVVLTDVSGVMTDFGTAEQKLIRHVSGRQLEAVTFPSGSMGPKVAAACRFVTATGGQAAIGSLDEASEVIAGNAGTQISQ